LNKKRFNSRRKVDSELAATTSVGSVFQMGGAATAKARLPTVDSLIGVKPTELYILWSKHGLQCFDAVGWAAGRASSL